MFEEYVLGVLQCTHPERLILLKVVMGVSYEFSFLSKDEKNFSISV